MNATTNKSYNGYTTGYCCSCSGTGTFQRQYGIGSAVSGPCFRCSGTGYVSARDAKRNWAHDTAGMGTGGQSGNVVASNDYCTTTAGFVTFAGVTMPALSSTTGRTIIEGKRGTVWVDVDGDDYLVNFSDTIPESKRASLRAPAIAAVATFRPA